MDRLSPHSLELRLQMFGEREKSFAARPGMLLYSFHLLLGLAFILYFSTFFAYTVRARAGLLTFHLLVSAPFWLLILSGCGWLLRTTVVRRLWFLKHLVRLIPAVLLQLILLLWLTDVIAIKHWGLNVSFPMAAKAIGDLMRYRALLMPGQAAAMLLGFIIVSVTAYHCVTERAIVDCAEVITICSRSLRRASRRKLAVTASLLAAGLCAGAVAFAPVWQRKDTPRYLQNILPWYIWQREPLFSFVILPLAKGNGEVLFPPTSRRALMATSDAAERSHYPHPSFPARNIIVIIVDCLRADHLSLYGYDRQTTPFLARLASEGRLRKVEEVRSSCERTSCGILSTLTSRNYDDLGKGLFSLQDLLKDEGYKTNFILSGQHSSWYDLRELYGPGIDFYFDGDHSRRFLASDDRTLFEGLEKVAPADDQPAFFYFHLMSAHETGIILPQYAHWQPSHISLWEKTWAGQGDQTSTVNTYDNGVLMADGTIEQLFSALDRKGYLHNSLVMILGDHGQALGEHNHYGHSQSVHEEELRIPLLIIDDPDIVYRNLSSALQLDVAPTILDRLSLPVPKNWRGQSLLEKDEHTVTFHQQGLEGGARALVYHDGDRLWKYIKGDATSREELYELHSDPHEENNLVTGKDVAVILNRVRELIR